MKHYFKCGGARIWLAALLLATAATVNVRAADSSESFKNEIQIFLRRGELSHFLHRGIEQQAQF